MEKQNVFFRKGHQVILRPVLAEDVNQFFIWINNPEITQYLLRSFPISLEQERDWQAGLAKPSGDKYTFAICDQKSGDLIGCIGIHDINFISGTAITGTFIGEPRYRGKGLGTEAKMLLLDFAFTDLNLRKIYSYVFAFNKASLAYAKKCGYEIEARLPKHYYKKGRYVDQVILAVYRKNWEKIAEKFFKFGRL